MQNSLYVWVRVASRIAAAAALASLAFEYGFERALVSAKVLHGVQIAAVILFVIHGTFDVLMAEFRKKALKSRWLDLLLLSLAGAALLVQYQLTHRQLLKAGAIYVGVIQGVVLARMGVGIAGQQLREAQHRLHPARLLATTFLVTIVIGGLLLSLPLAMSPEQRNVTGVYQAKRVLNCFFISTSATCVTGLTMYDSEKDFTRFGQIVIMLLIQIGGLGIMIFSSMSGLMMGRRLSLRESLLMQDALSYETIGLMSHMVKFIVGGTLLLEAVGAVLLYPVWPDAIGPASTKWFYSVFHSVSAFCNAGFALNRDNLIPYRNAWGVYVSIMPLIVLGGLGFPVLHDLAGIGKERLAALIRRITTPGVYGPFGERRGQRYRISLHSKLVLSTTAILILAPALLLLLIESPHRFQSHRQVTPTGEVVLPPDSDDMIAMPFLDRCLAALFQSVTTRTAGFNTVPTDEESLSPASFFLICTLMFIGGSPASTAGGIKTATAAVMLLAVLAAFKRRESVEAFRRTITTDNVKRAAAITVIMFVVHSLVILILCITERGSFLEIFFESVSAINTVGLSAGLTPKLTIAGRMLIMVAMFTGRVGPLTVIVALGRGRGGTRYDYPEEQVIVG